MLAFFFTFCKAAFQWLPLLNAFIVEHPWMDMVVAVGQRVLRSLVISVFPILFRT